MDNQKILIYLTAVGDARILKIKKYEINYRSKFGIVRDFIKKKILNYNKELYLYIKNDKKLYYPNEEDIIGKLYDKFKIGNNLIINYSHYMEYDNKTIYNPDLIKTNLENLTVLGNLQKYDKLIRNIDGLFEIETSNLLQGIRRWYNGDNRKNTIKYITECLEHSFKITNILIYKEKINISLLQQYLLQFKLVCRGLNYLKNTYDQDKTTYLHLELLQDQCDIRINKINSLLKINK